MRRKPCCDCGETVAYDPYPLVWELIRPYLIICNVCATARKLEAGGLSWTYKVEPRPRDP